MQAVILAAGIGNRLGEHADNKPKSLMEFGGKSLLQRHIDNLSAVGINTVHIVVGYQSNMIVDHLRHASADIHFINNDHYTDGSLISLGCAREVITSEPQFILMDADVLYDRKILQRLVDTDKQNCLLIDRDFIPGDEPVKVCIDSHDRIIDFRKKIAPDLVYEKQGESVGFFKFEQEIGNELMQRMETYLANNEKDTPYEEAIRDCLLLKPEVFGYEDITGMAWIEIDFPEDMIRARDEILPNI